MSNSYGIKNIIIPLFRQLFRKVAEDLPGKGKMTPTYETVKLDEDPGSEPEQQGEGCMC